MGETHTLPAWARFRGIVTGLMEAVEPFGDVEDVIDDRAHVAALG